MTTNNINTVTGEQVKDAMIAANITEVEHHDCGLCGYMTRYIRDGEQLYFDSGCGCSGGSALQVRQWESASDWINIQSTLEGRERLAQKFGLTLNFPARLSGDSEETQESSFPAKQNL